MSPSLPSPHAEWTRASESFISPPTMADRGRTTDPRISSIRDDPARLPVHSSHDPRLSTTAEDGNIGLADLSHSDDDDPIDAGVHMVPLRDLTRREEEARLVKEGHAEDPKDYRSPLASGSSRKRPHEEGSTHAERLVRRKGDLSKSFLDPVQLGLCSEAEGRALFESSVDLI